MPKKIKKTKEDKLYESLLKVTRQMIMGRSFVPGTVAEMMERLSLPLQHRPVLIKILDDLTAANEISCVNNRYVRQTGGGEVFAGTIRMHHRGFGFVETDNNAFSDDVFIPKHMTKNAVDGDKVEIMINTESLSGKGPEGRVIGIVERGRSHIAGIIKEIHKSGEIIAYVPILGQSQKVVVDPGEHELKEGDRLVMEVTDWGSKDTETLARFSRYLGHISDHKCDIKAAIEEYQLASEFSPESIAEAEKFGKSVPKKEIDKREDFRELECFTIDPDTAKDFDDALTLTKDKNGNFLLGVHIADVTAYVLPGSALDKDARVRANSTYFPGYCLPMLPKELSNNLCSLKPNVNRLTVSVMMTLDAKGDLLEYRTTRSVIRSQKRFTYKEAKQVLDGEKKSPHLKTLKLMVELCNLLKQKRFERGSLELALPDLVVMVDEEGFPLRTEYVEYDITHQLVEEFMLKANEVVAKHLTDRGDKLTYRVHDNPPEESLKDFVSLVRAFGFELNDAPSQEELQNFFNKVSETPYAQHLATSYIRRMRMAVYSPDNIGHYGLSLEHYCHFTSPIRRYADLIVHRILLDGPMSPEILETISAHCSEQERISAKAESGVKLLKKLRLLEAIREVDPDIEYDAVITTVKAWGITIEILAFMMESFTHISEIGDDYFEFEERKMRLIGRNTKTVYRSGEDVKAVLRNVNFITLESKWDIIAPEVIVEKKPERKKAKPKEKGKRSTGKKRAGKQKR